MLDKRKVEILTQVVEYYIDLAEPIGSRTLSKYSSLGVSPATIRNEMSDLEDLGFLTKTHSSSGRIPSDKAYRFYVNLLMEEGIKSNIEETRGLKDKLFGLGLDRLEVYRLANKLLADITSYTTILISPIADSTSINYLKLDIVNKSELILILVVEGNKSKTHLIESDLEFSKTELLVYENFLRKKIVGRALDEIIKALDSKEFPQYERITHLIIDFAVDFIRRINEYSIYYSGIGNVLNFWSGEDIQEAKDFIDYIEDKNNLLELATGQALEDVLSIRIGHENKDEVLKDFSIVTTSYRSSKLARGKISVIGPTSMDYKKLVSTILGFSTILSELNKAKR